MSLFNEARYTLTRSVALSLDFLGRKGALRSLREEVDGLSRAVFSGDKDRVRAEVGNVILSACAVAFSCAVEPEPAFRAALRRVANRLDRVQEWSVAVADREAAKAQARRLWVAAKEAEVTR